MENLKAIVKYSQALIARSLRASGSPASPKVVMLPKRSEGQDSTNLTQAPADSPAPSKSVPVPPKFGGTGIF